MDYLKQRQFYEVRYDLHTIKVCLKDEQFWQDIYRKKDNNERFKDIPKEEIDRGFNYLRYWHLLAIKGERYRRRKETLNTWIEEAHAQQEKIDLTPTPSGVHCSYCHHQKLIEKSRHLEDLDTSKPLRVLFLLECSSCRKRKWTYDNGEEHISKPDLCPNCSREIETKCTLQHRVLTTTAKCPHVVVSV